MIAELDRALEVLRGLAGNWVGLGTSVVLGIPNRPIDLTAADDFDT